jgi:hypothetical protein
VSCIKGGVAGLQDRDNAEQSQHLEAVEFSDTILLSVAEEVIEWVIRQPLMALRVSGNLGGYNGLSSERC